MLNQFILTAGNSQILVLFLPLSVYQCKDRIFKETIISVSIKRSYLICKCSCLFLSEWSAKHKTQSMS